jgi:hypothetical protein
MKKLSLVCIAPAFAFFLFSVCSPTKFSTSTQGNKDSQKQKEDRKVDTSAPAPGEEDASTGDLNKKVNPLGEELNGQTINTNPVDPNNPPNNNPPNNNPPNNNPPNSNPPNNNPPNSNPPNNNPPNNNPPNGGGGQTPPCEIPLDLRIKPDICIPKPTPTEPPPPPPKCNNNEFRLKDWCVLREPGHFMNFLPNAVYWCRATDNIIDGNECYAHAPNNFGKYYYVKGTFRCIFPEGGCK